VDAECAGAANTLTAVRGGGLQGCIRGGMGVYECVWGGGYEGGKGYEGVKGGKSGWISSV
jgi:hypothetical protein